MTGRKNLLYLGILVILLLLFLFRTRDPQPRSRIGTVGQMAYLVEQVLEGSPAEEAGLIPGDLVIGVDGVAVESRPEFFRLVGRLNAEAGAPLTLRVLRYHPDLAGWQSREVTIGNSPNEETAQP